MTIDALVLAGGRSSRLGGVAKAHLIFEGTSLLQRAMASASACRRVVVVGERMPAAIYAREEPPFGGPAAGIAAGLRALGPSHADHVLVLACDAPYAASAVAVLMASRDSLRDCDGLVAVDAGGRNQPLLALYAASALLAAIDRPDLDGLSVRELLAGLRLISVTVPPGSTDDVDTWPDAARLRVVRPSAVNAMTERSSS